MENRAHEIKSRKNSNIKIRVIPGHFATNHSHINYYIDLTQLKSGIKEASDVADQLANSLSSTPVDAIVCMDGCVTVATCLAQKLSTTRNSASYGNDINVIEPEFNSNNQMIFQDNLQKMIWGKHVLLLIASATTGKTIRRSLECIQYYNGISVGVAAIFSAIDEIIDVKITSVFDTDDIPDYKTYTYYECPACAQKQKIDAIVNSHGYSKI